VISWFSKRMFFQNGSTCGRYGLGQHATKLIGWGFDPETNDPYWLMMNSWRNWGKDGAGWVGVGEMNIEGGISMMKM
jgi:cathepsin B